MKKPRITPLLASALLVVSAFGAEARERQVSSSSTGGTRSSPSASGGSSSRGSSASSSGGSSSRGSSSGSSSSTRSSSSSSSRSTSGRESSRSSSSERGYTFSSTGRVRSSRGSSSGGSGGHSGGGHSGGGYHGGGHYGGSWGGNYYGGWYGGGWYSPRYSNSYFDAWYYPFWCSVGWWWGLGTWGRPYAYVTVVDRPGRYGRLDLDVSPEEAEIHLNGKYIGTADDFDGHPDYLYLKPGNYTLEFKLAGHVGVKKDVEVERGDFIRLSDELGREPGRGRLDSFTPESKGMPFGRLFGPNGPLAEDMDEDEEMAGSVDEVDEMDEDEEAARPARREPPVRAGAQSGTGGASARATGSADEGWREGKSSRAEAERAPEPAPSLEPSTPARPPVAADGRARLRLKVTPEDAAVYVDDRYFGTGEDATSSRKGISLDPGKHTITVVRPGFAPKSLDIEAKAGEETILEIALVK